MSLDASLDLLRRLPPEKTAHNLHLLQSLLSEDVSAELLQSVDQPLSTRTCSKTGREYLLCDYNRDGDSYRSPWSGEWEPKIDDPVVLDEGIRELEIKANDAFDSYRDLYYEGGVSSVYMWDLDDGIAGVVLFKKTTPGAGWDSVHVFEALDRTRTASYKLTSTVMLHLTTSSPALGSMNLSGNLTRQVEQDYPLESPTSHIPNLGRMIEDQEIKIRNSLQEVYFGKCKDIVNDLRSLEKISVVAGDRKAHGLVVEGLTGAHRAKEVVISRSSRELISPIHLEKPLSSTPPEEIQFAPPLKQAIILCGRFGKVLARSDVMLLPRRGDNKEYRNWKNTQSERRRHDHEISDVGTVRRRGRGSVVRSGPGWIG